MQVLEKILQEIESAKKEPLFRLCDYTYRDRQNRIIARIEEIIRSHMEDELVSNSDKLDGDKKEYINIQDEQLWDILFEEACVEGEQADRIKRRLREICASSMDDGWIPVEMKDDEWTSETVLPEEGQKVFVTISYNGNARMVERAYFEDGSFWDNQRIALDYITKAWMPRFVPAPYQPKPKEQ